MNTKVFEDAIPTFNVYDPANNHLFAELREKFPSYDYRYINFAVEKDSREYVEKIYSEAKDYLDPNFLVEIRKPGAFFLQKFWELQVFAMLKLAGYDLQLISKSSIANPDFCFLYRGKKVWVECVCPELGKSPENNPTKVMEVGVMHITDATTEQNLMGLRVSNALSNKKTQYDTCLASGIVSADDLYFVAIDTSNIAGVTISHRAMDQVLFGFSADLVHQNGHYSTKFEPKLFKKKGEETVGFDAAYLIGGKHNWLSGVITGDFFSRHDMGVAEYMKKKLFTHFNFSLTDIPEGIFNFTTRRKLVYGEGKKITRLEEF